MPSIGSWHHRNRQNKRIELIGISSFWEWFLIKCDGLWERPMSSSPRKSNLVNCLITTNESIREIWILGLIALIIRWLVIETILWFGDTGVGGTEDYSAQLPSFISTINTLDLMDHASMNPVSDYIITQHYYQRLWREEWRKLTLPCGLYRFDRSYDKTFFSEWMASEMGFQWNRYPCFCTEEVVS